MKGILGLVVLLAIGIAAYFLMGGGDDAPELTPAVESTEPETTEETVEETVESVTEEASDPVEDAVESVEGALETLQEEAEAAVEGAREELQDTADAVEEQVNDAVNALQEGANSLLEGAADTANDAMEGTSNLAEDASDAAEGTASRIQNALESALGEAADTDVEGGELTEEEMNANLEHDAPAGESDEILADALTIEGFDPLVIRDAIQNADMSDLSKVALERLVTQAEDNPEQIQSVVGQLREALGL